MCYLVGNKLVYMRQLHGGCVILRFCRVILLCDILGMSQIKFHLSCYFVPR